MTTTHLAAILGFLFAAVWLSSDFGSAVLCLLGAAVFALAERIRTGDVDLADVQERIQQPSGRSAPSRSAGRATAPRRRVR